MNNETETRQYLVFKLDKIKYAIEITQVQEVIQWVEPTQLPSSPDYSRGVINLRGRTIPVIDLNKTLSIHNSTQATPSVIIVLSLLSASGHKLIGFDVDAVSDVRRINDNDIQDQDIVTNTDSTSSVRGVYMDNEDTLVIINATRLLELSDFKFNLAA